MEQERRQDIRADLQMRQAHTDRLMAMSGQPIVQDRSHPALPNNCSTRSLELSQPRQVQLPKDVTNLTDFRGLVHADNEHALEALYPGFGHDLSVGFRESATRSIEPGWPAPPAAETPRRPHKSKSREHHMKKGGTMMKGSIPASSHRLEKIATRTNEDILLKHSKAQFLQTRAPPPPNQRKSLLHEDFSPTSTLQDPLRVTGDYFSRTDQSLHPAFSEGGFARKAQESLPPPVRSMVYPVVVASQPSSPKARSSQAGSPSATAMRQTDGSWRLSSGSPNVTSMKRYASEPSLSVTSMASSGRPRRGAGRNAAVVADVCNEMDNFESKVSTVPNASNFFATPRSAGQGPSCSQPINGPAGAALQV